MGQLSAQCPHCRARMRLQKPELIGKTARCPACKEAFVIEAVPSDGPESTGPLPAGTQEPGAVKLPRKKVVGTVRQAPKAAPASRSGKSSPARAKARPDIDFDVDEAQEILEAEVVQDDEWLDALDELSPTDIGKRPLRTGGAAPVVRGRPGKPAGGPTKKRKRRLRDADGELPLWMSRTLTVVIGATAGAIAMLIWAGFVAKTGLPSRWMPMFIGATVGTGVRLGASKWDFGLFPAVTAALIALTAVIGGKVIGWHLMRHQAMELQAMQARYKLLMVKDENYPLHLMAEEIHSQYITDNLEDSQTLYDYSTELTTEADFAEFYNPKRLPDVYSAARWKEAQDRWNALTDEERKEYENQIAATIEDLTAVANMDVGAELQRDDEFRTAVGESGGALGILDFIMAAVAVVGAFKIAAGMADSAIDTSQGH